MQMYVQDYSKKQEEKRQKILSQMEEESQSNFKRKPVPDFIPLQQKFEQKLLSRRREYRPTEPKPFKFEPSRVSPSA